MTQKDRALKALQAAFPDTSVTAEDCTVSRAFESGWQYPKDIAPKPCYRFRVTHRDGTFRTAGCWFGDEFMEQFKDDDALKKAFEERFMLVLA